MASIYILFPKEQPELVSPAMQHFRWAVERFEAMSERNALARAALGVLHAIHIRLKKSLNYTTTTAASSSSSLARSPPPPPLAPRIASANNTPAAAAAAGGGDSPDGAPFGGGGSSSSATASVAGQGGPGSSSLGSAVTPTTAASSEYYSDNTNGTTGGGGGGGFDFNLPSNFDWSSIQPIFATGDLVYNDLVGIPDGSEMQTQWGALGGGGVGVGAQPQQQPWQFEGDFGNDSVWNLLNQYTPL